MVKRILRKYKYPPDLQDAAVELVLQQAQVMGGELGGRVIAPQRRFSALHLLKLPLIHTYRITASQCRYFLHNLFFTNFTFLTH